MSILICYTQALQAQLFALFSLIRRSHIYYHACILQLKELPGAGSTYLGVRDYSVNDFMLKIALHLYIYVVFIKPDNVEASTNFTQSQLYIHESKGWPYRDTTNNLSCF